MLNVFAACANCDSHDSDIIGQEKPHRRGAECTTAASKPLFKSLKPFKSIPDISNVLNDWNI
jgi:hypothetical protein